MAEPEGIGVDAWRKALAKASSDGADGMTLLELAELWGVHEGTAGNRIRALWRKGLVYCSGKRHTTRVDGRASQTPVYRLKEAKDGL